LDPGTALRAISKALVLPPGTVIVLLGAALVLTLGHQRRLGIALTLAATATLYLLSAPVVASLLLRQVETHRPIDWRTIDEVAAQAVVVLAGGRRRADPAFENHDVVSQRTLARLRYGVRVHRATGLPLTLVGGTTAPRLAPEADLMQRSLIRDFGLSARWLERRSRNTFENAVFTRTLLAPLGIDHVILVTEAFHMPRAAEAFEAAGFEVTAAPADFQAGTLSLDEPGAYLPSPWALTRSYLALHELLGRMWYRLVH
jgi:uncharacterized SAM-binding protein YcdF (DUF218 family)